MKKILFLIALLCIANYLKSQPPQGISYQAVARKSNGDLIKSHPVSLRFSIHDSIPTGTIVYQETQNTNTNSLGLFSVNIGQGNPVTGTFNSINWGNNTKFLQVELDIFEGDDFIDMGTQQMMSVPYALYSQSAGTLKSFPLTIQERLNAGETPKHIYDSGVPKEFLNGKLYAGGVIFYLNEITGTGLVAATEDQSIGATWYNGLYLNTNVRATAIGTGQSNTTAIIEIQGIGNYAAYICDTLNLNGYSDWYLPSLDEIKEMANIYLSYYYLYFSTHIYWSSTEEDNIVAWNLYDGSINSRPKSDLYGVHAIRSFLK